MTNIDPDELSMLLRETLLWTKIHTSVNLLFGAPLLIQAALTLSLMREHRDEHARHADGLHYLDSLPGIFTRLFDRLSDLERHLWSLLGSRRPPN